MRLYAWHIVSQRVCYPLLIANLIVPNFFEDTKSGTGFTVTMMLFAPLFCLMVTPSESGSGCNGRSRYPKDAPFAMWLHSSWPR